MQIIYDIRTDTLTITFRDAYIVESDEQEWGIIFDYDATGEIVAIEVLDASRRITQPTQIMYQFVGYEVPTQTRVKEFQFAN